MFSARVSSLSPVPPPGFGGAGGSGGSDVEVAAPTAEMDLDADPLDDDGQVGDGGYGVNNGGGLGVKSISIEDVEKHEFISQLSFAASARKVTLFPPTDQQQPGGLPLASAEQEPSMKDLLAAITGLTTNVGGVTTSLSEFRTEMTVFILRCQA